MQRPEVWTRIERYNVEESGRDAMQRVGVFRPADLMAGDRFIVAWRPRNGITGPGFCRAPFASMGNPFLSRSDTEALPPDIEAPALLEIAADMAMNGAPLPLLDAAFLVFPAWRAMTVRDRVVAHTPGGVWSPHNPDYADEVLDAYRADEGMFQRRREHDLAEGLPAVEIVTGFHTA